MTLHKPSVLAGLISFVKFNTELERQINNEVAKDTTQLGIDGLKERIKNVNVRKLTKAFDEKRQVPIIEGFKMLPPDEGKEKSKMRVFKPIYRIVEVRIIGLFGDINGLEDTGLSTIFSQIDGIFFDVPYGLNPTLPYDAVAYKPEEVSSFNETIF